MSKSKIPHGIIKIPSSLKDSFFKYWFEFLRPLHRLTPRETDVITAFVKQRYELSKLTKDDFMLDQVLMTQEIKEKVRNECGLSLPHFQVIMGKLREGGLIIDGSINKRFIPNIKEEDGHFKLLLLFEFENEEK